MELADFLRDRSNLILDKAEGRIKHAHLTHYEQAGTDSPAPIIGTGREE